MFLLMMPAGPYRPFAWTQAHGAVGLLSFWLKVRVGYGTPPTAGTISVKPGSVTAFIFHEFYGLVSFISDKQETIQEVLF